MVWLGTVVKSLPRNSLLAIGKASSPLTRIIEMAPSPIAVAIPAIVSCNMWTPPLQLC